MKCTIANNSGGSYFSFIKIGETFTLMGLKNTVLMRIEDAYDENEALRNVVNLTNGKLLYVGASDTVLRLNAEIKAEYV